MNHLLLRLPHSGEEVIFSRNWNRRQEFQATCTVSVSRKKKEREKEALFNHAFGEMPRGLRVWKIALQFVSSEEQQKNDGVYSLGGRTP